MEIAFRGTLAQCRNLCVSLRGSGLWTFLDERSCTLTVMPLPVKWFEVGIL